MFSNPSKAGTKRWGAPAAILLITGSVIAAILGSGNSAEILTAGSLPDIAAPVSAKGEPQETPIEQTTPDPVRTTGEMIVITPRGFEPGVLRKPTGQYIFALINRAENDNMVIRLQSENERTILRTVEIPRTRRRMNIPITLTPGRYKLVDLNRPETVCNIEITQ